MYKIVRKRRVIHKRIVDMDVIGMLVKHNLIRVDYSSARRVSDVLQTIRQYLRYLG